MKNPNEVTVGISLPNGKTHVFNTEETEPTAIKAMVDDWCLKQYGTKPKTTLYEVKRIPITTEGQVA